MKKREKLIIAQQNNPYRGPDRDENFAKQIHLVLKVLTSDKYSSNITREEMAD